MYITSIWPRYSDGFFWLVALINIWAINTQNDIVDLITKPLLLSILLFYFISNKKTQVYIF